MLLKFNMTQLLLDKPVKLYLFIFLSIFMPQHVIAQIAVSQFTDNTAVVGFTYNGQSFGASWGDINGDNLPDLFVNNHRGLNSLYINNGDGTFTDRAAELDVNDRWVVDSGADTHGATWMDYDNDGDKDLYIGTGGRGSSQFFDNVGGTLVDRTFDYNLALNISARQPLFFDYNDDGLLDFVMLRRSGDILAPLFEQILTGFVDTTATMGLVCNEPQMGTLSDVDNDGRLELMCGLGTFPDKVFNTGTTPFTEITTIPKAGLALDAVTVDFDNNLRPDIFVVRGGQRHSEAVLVNNKYIEAQLIGAGSKVNGFDFVHSGVINAIVDWERVDQTNIFIGSTGWNPATTDFTLDSSNPAVAGIKPFTSSTDRGLYIGYVSGSWRFRLSAGGVYNYMTMDVTSTTNMSNLVVTGLVNSDLPMQNSLRMNNAGGFVNATTSSGLGAATSCVSAVAGDFDNDMDQDLYMVCRSGVTNLANRLYENQGDGTFILVSNAGGAAGVTGSGVGVGENVAMADYDADGFLDLFTTNGLNLLPLDRGGPDQFFRNNGNSNNWLEMDLEGTISNRDGVGAKIFATASGLTQLREQNGGYHRWAQNHQRIHFGLATNTLVDIRIEWPSGVVDQHLQVPVNNVYRFTESGGYVVVIPGNGTPTCGAPGYDPSVDSAVLLWQDCATGKWFLRAMAGSQGSAQYSGNLSSSLGFTNITPVSLEAGDTFDTTDPTQITFALQMASPWIDGFDFVLPVGTNTCLTLDTVVLVGASRTSVSSPFNLQDFGPCTAPSSTLSVNDTTVAESNGTASFTVTLTPASPVAVTVDVSTADGTASAPSDYTSVPTTTLTFNAGETSKVLNVPIIDDTIGESTENFSVNLSNAVNAVIGKASGTGTITDNDISACGAPSINGATDRAIFIWQDCGSGQWHLRSTAGIPGYVRYVGNLSSDLGFLSISPFSLEGHDVFDTTNPNLINFNFQIWGTSQDGFDFQLPANANTCFTVGTPADATVLIGASRTPVTMPFNLETFASCL